MKYYNTEEDPDLRHHENENASYSYSLRLPDDVKTAPELAELAAVLNAINAEYHKAQPAPVLRSWEDPQPPASLGEYNHRTPAKWLDAIESAGINRAIRDPRDLEYRPYASRIHAEYKRFITEDAHFTVTVFTDTHERAQQESLRMWLKMAAQSYQPDQTMEKINAWTAQGKPVSEVTPSRYWHNEQPLDYRPAHKIVRILDMDELYTPPAPEPEDDQEQEQEQEDQPPSC